MKHIDIHNHVLYGIDDGVKTRNETIEMLKRAEQHNIEKIIVTPHFKEGIFENDKTIVEQKLIELKDIIREEQLNLEVYPGSEIMLTKNTSEYLANNRLQTLNDTKYILVETHRAFISMIYDLKEELYNLAVDGYKVILAHPERYEMTHENINLIYEFVNDGHLMQVNVTSLSEKSHFHKIVKKLLDHNLVHFIASDAHNLDDRPLILDYGYEKIKKNYSKEFADTLFYHNPLKVIQNETISIGDIRQVKSKKMLFF